MKSLIIALALVLALPASAYAGPRPPRDLRVAHQHGIRIGTAVDIAALRGRHG
ncbi:hypothetical protein [Nonomuraea diastatica]|uniref:hypothetical protein n=1 Tax=Nonomuraea diastatica TaxID=1848329 RepID=UPI00140B359D|nr:hypothetical protein [Nonomuraea diastatica]